MRRPPLSFAALALSFACVSIPVRADVNHPFGSRPMSYVAGSIRPNHLSQSALDQAVLDFYDAWKARYLEQTCGAGRYVVLSDTQPGNLTVSEAHGYGMLLSVLMAGHDPDARAIFDGMLAYFREHPSVYTPNLMAWYQSRSCESAEGGDSASDGDLDIAYALLLADKQWGSCGAIDYAAAASQVLAAIRTGDIDSGGNYIRLGDWTDPSEPSYYEATRSSDFMPGHLREFAAASGDSVWTEVLDTTYSIFDSLQTNFSPATGLLPDFIADPLGSPAPVAPFFLEGPNDGAYDYNACRDPWRLATDYLGSGDMRAKTAVQRITSWIRTTTGNSPANIQAGYQLDGSLSVDADYESLAFTAPLAVGAMTDSANQAWVNAMWDRIVATPIDDGAYYENTLKLLAMVVLSGNWWTPSSASGGCVPQTTPLCSNGGYLTGVDLKLGGLTTGPDRQSLKLKGHLFFPSGIPATSPYVDGAQIRIEDAGNGDAIVFDASRFTTAVPPQAAGTCDSKDTWKTSGTRTSYKNSSGKMDPPTCSAGSAGGLRSLKYRQRSALDLDLELKARKTDISTTPVGPLRVTFVLGSDQGASDNGRCAISAEIPCVASGKILRCRN